MSLRSEQPASDPSSRAADASAEPSQPSRRLVVAGVATLAAGTVAGTGMASAKRPRHPQPTAPATSPSASASATPTSQPSSTPNGGGATGVSDPSIGSGGGVVATTADRSVLFGRIVTKSDTSNTVIEVKDVRDGGPIEGFGGALTHSSAQLMLKMDADRRGKLLHDFFSPNGVHRLNALRIPIGTSDFVANNDYYTFADVKGSAAEPLGKFSISRDESTILPVLREIVAINPNLTVIMSPWSAPAWLKTTNKLIGGALKDDETSRLIFADYLAKSVEAYKAAVPGLKVAAVSLQNEPGWGQAAYPCMTISADVQANVIARTQDALAQRGLKDTGVYVHDHNWINPEEPNKVLTDLANAGRSAWGVGFHAYKGDAAPAGDAVESAHPGTRLWVTEQSGTQDPNKPFEQDFREGLGWMSNTLFLPALNHHHRGVILFNLVLDQDGGPGPATFTNGTGLVQFDTRVNTLTPNSEFFVMSHFSRFIAPGSKLLNASSSAQKLSFLAARSGDQDVVVLYNDQGGRDITVKCGNRQLTSFVPEGSIATYVLPKA